MKKNNILGIILTFAIFALIVWLIFSFNNRGTNRVADTEYNSTRTSLNQISNEEITNTLSENNTNTEIPINKNTTDNKNETSIDENSNKVAKENITKTIPVNAETEISTFTTKIYTKDSGRQHNLTLACSALNDTIVENGKTFSFSNTVGKATSKKGYKKADVFKNGDVIEALGGGLCQVSTTLYNAVLKIPNTKVIERHSHSNKVPYIKSGRDAAVSYGTYDFKFVNNTGNSLKIKASNTKNNVTVKIMTIK